METQTVAIQVAPQTAAILQAQAAAQGVSLDALLWQHFAEDKIAVAPPKEPKENAPGRKSLLGAFQHMKLEVTLGFMLKMMRGPIEQSVHEQLDKALKDGATKAELKPAMKTAAKSTTATTVKKPAAKKK